MMLFIISVIKGISVAFMLLFTLCASILFFVWNKYKLEGLKDVPRKLNCALLCVLQQSRNLKTKSL